MCGMVSKRALEMDLFHIYKRMGRKSVLFPQNLNTFISNFPPTTKLSIDEIILRHTMYPFYTCFLSKQESKKVYLGMAEGCGKSIENLVGIAGSKVKPHSYLRYCPLCFAKDMNEFGESYWRRLPQVPGVLYCPEHQVLYKNSNVIINDNRNDFLCADEDTCNTELEVDAFLSEFKELNLKYTKNVLFLFQNKIRKDLYFIINFYVDKLRDRGLASKTGSLYMNKLIGEFIEYFPADYLELMQSSVLVDQDANWLRRFVRNIDKNRSPLRHLLFLQFLNVGVQELFNTVSVIGKLSIQVNRTPLYSFEERRDKWLQLIKENPDANRSELKKIGKGLHTWIYINDREWYEEVTPKPNIRKKRDEAVDWKKRDEECLMLAIKAVEELYQTEGRPIRIIPSNIRRLIGAKRWFLHKKLVKAQKYLQEITEDIESYRERKIIWAIGEMIKNGEKLTVYKINLFAGFGGANNKGINEQITNILSEYK